MVKGLIIISMLFMTSCASKSYIETLREQRMSRNSFSISYETTKLSSKRTIINYMKRKADTLCLDRKGMRPYILLLEIEYVDKTYNAKIIFRCKRLSSEVRR